MNDSDIVIANCHNGTFDESPTILYDNIKSFTFSSPDTAHAYSVHNDKVQLYDT